MYRLFTICTVIALATSCRSTRSTLAIDVTFDPGTPSVTSLQIEVKQGIRTVVTRTFSWRPDQAQLGIFLPDDVSGAVQVVGRGRDDKGEDVAKGEGSATVIPSEVSEVLTLIMRRLPTAPGNGQPEICKSGGCVSPPSCGGLPPLCGPFEDQDCCASLIVPGGTFNRDNDPDYPATVGRFALDAYEVTVARFRSFLIRYPSTSYPSAGAGAHPKLGAQSGWQHAWDPYLPPSSESIEGKLTACATPHAWTIVSGPNEIRPVSCVTWYLAFAFCAWDGGRLPTEAEWSFAAVGGDQQRVYPWSSPPEPGTISPEQASYDCASRNECNSITSLIAVGSRPSGNGRWGHADLAGNVWEWTLDTTFRCAPGSADCPPCVDCTNGSPSSQATFRMIHGGSFMQDSEQLLLARSRTPQVTNAGDYTFLNDQGFRCARDPI